LTRSGVHPIYTILPNFNMIGDIL